MLLIFRPASVNRNLEALPVAVGADGKGVGVLLAQGRGSVALQADPHESDAIALLQAMPGGRDGNGLGLLRLRVRHDADLAGDKPALGAKQLGLGGEAAPRGSQSRLSRGIA